jgi:flagellar protein FlaG
MNVINFVENFNTKVKSSGNGFHGDRAHPVHKSEEAHHEREGAEPAEVKKAVDELNRLSGNFNEKVRFSVDDKTNRVIIKVMNRETNEVISEIPGKYSIRLLEHFREYMGLFIDESR